jgi:prephenate dehydrogenase
MPKKVRLHNPSTRPFSVEGSSPGSLQGSPPGSSPGSSHGFLAGRALLSGYSGGSFVGSGTEKLPLVPLLCMCFRMCFSPDEPQIFWRRTFEGSSGARGGALVHIRKRLGARPSACLHPRRDGHSDGGLGMLNQLTIFGAGLIGGSIALGARDRQLAQRVIAVNTDGGARFSERERSRFADEWIRADDDARLRAAYSASDLVILTSPVHSIIRELPRALGSGAVVTDAGSTKLAICVAARQSEGGSRFVPSHPMAGHPEGGLEHARSDLFVERRWLLCPDGSNADAVALVSKFAQGLGAQVIELEAMEHDRAVAITSHVPQVVASALAALGSERRAEVAAGPGYASATRVAGGAEAMWRDIFATNAEAIGVALDLLEKELLLVREGLERGDTSAALELLARARRVRQGG